MVNAGQRMRPLSYALFRLQYLAGSVTLPAAPKPQLKAIRLRVPSGRTKFMKFYAGARKFWHEELVRLKYRNPALAVTVEKITKPKINEPFYLTAEFESNDRDALAKLQTSPLPKPLMRLPAGRQIGTPRGTRLINAPKEGEEPPKIHNFVKEISTDPTARVRFHNPSRMWREMGQQFHSLKEPRPRLKDTKPVEFSRFITEHAPKDEIVAKPQPAADTSKPQSTSAPETLYTRHVTTPLTGLRNVEIWNWVKQLQHLPDRSNPPKEEMDAHLERKAGERARTKDRARQRNQIGYVKRSAKRLEKAKAEAQRITEDI